MSFSSMISAEVATHITDQDMAEKPQRLSSRWRGLYYDAKHAAWRVRIFYLGKQRHIGRYKDETLAAQAYDRAAYYLYGTRANLNFRLVDVLADPSDVPASIKLAKEQPFVGPRLQSVQSAFNANTNTGCASSSSSTCSYSPHSSRQNASMHNSPAYGYIQGYVTAGDPLQQQQQLQMGIYMSQQQQHQVLMCVPQQQQQQQQQMAACMSQQPQLLSQQQAVSISNLHPGWVQQQQQQQQQVMPQGVIGVAPAPLPLTLQQQQQQQQVAISTAMMPEVVTSMIAGLCFENNHGVPQSTALVTSSCSTQANPTFDYSVGNTTGLQAVHAASAAQFQGFLASNSAAGAASSSSNSSSAGLLLAQSIQQQHLNWPSNTSTPFQGAPIVQLGFSGNNGSMSMPNGQLMPAQFATAAGHAGNVSISLPISTSGQVMPLGYLTSAGSALQQQQQQQQARQLQAHSMSGFTSPHGVQHSTQHGTAGAVYHPQQLAGNSTLQVMMPDGVVLTTGQLSVMPGAWSQQQQQVLLS